MNKVTSVFTNFLLACASCTLLPSCAIVLNGHYQKIEIASDSTIKNISINNDIIPNQEDYIFIERSKHPLKIKFTIGEKKDSMQIASGLSSAYSLGNLYTPYFSGYLIDLLSPKRFAFPREIYLKKNGSLVDFRKTIPCKPGTTKLIIGTPYINAYKVRTDRWLASEISLLGIHAGVEYYTTPLEFWSVTWGITGTPDDYYFNLFLNNSLRKSTVSYFYFRKHYVFNRIDVGFGGGMSSTQWKYENRFRRIVRGNNVLFDVSTAASIRCSRAFHIGVTYNHGLFDQTMEYHGQSYFAVQLMYKIKIGVF